jgi:hypothetical protein
MLVTGPDGSLKSGVRREVADLTGSMKLPLVGRSRKKRSFDRWGRDGNIQSVIVLTGH